MFLCFIAISVAIVLEIAEHVMTSSVNRVNRYGSHTKRGSGQNIPTWMSSHRKRNFVLLITAEDFLYAAQMRTF